MVAVDHAVLDHFRPVFEKLLEIRSFLFAVTNIQFIVIFI